MNRIFELKRYLAFLCSEDALQIKTFPNGYLRKMGLGQRSAFFIRNGKGQSLYRVSTSHTCAREFKLFKLKASRVLATARSIQKYYSNVYKVHECEDNDDEYSVGMGWRLLMHI